MHPVLFEVVWHRPASAPGGQASPAVVAQFNTYGEAEQSIADSNAPGRYSIEKRWVVS